MGGIYCCPFFLLASCSGIGNDAFLKDLRENPDAGRLIGSVPFFYDEGIMCGPASVAGVISFWGMETTIEEAKKEVFNADVKGALPIDLFLYAKKKGLDAAYMRGGIPELKENISKGIPLILFVDLGINIYPKRHYMVAVGYNDRLKSVMVNSGGQKGLVMGYEELISVWRKTDFSMLIIKPKGL